MPGDSRSAATPAADAWSRRKGASCRVTCQLQPRGLARRVLNAAQRRRLGKTTKWRTGKAGDASWERIGRGPQAGSGRTASRRRRIGGSSRVLGRSRCAVPPASFDSSPSGRCIVHGSNLECTGQPGHRPACRAKRPPRARVPRGVHRPTLAPPANRNCRIRVK
eukprot:COSAG03_NODE_715_length_6134_cov_4.062966_1_plen_164_part_00